MPYITKDEIFETGDLVIYNPPYPVDGKWLVYQKNKQEFVVVRGNDGFDSNGDRWTTIVVTDLQYAGMERRNIPYSKAFSINASAFYLASGLQPTWEI